MTDNVFGGTLNLTQPTCTHVHVHALHYAHETLLGTVWSKHLVMLWSQHSWAQCIPVAPMKLQLSAEY